MVDSVIQEAVQLCLDNWTALNLALDMGWGEPSQKSSFTQELTNYILHYEVEPEDIQNLLEDTMEQTFSVILEDDSAKDISMILFKVLQEHFNGQDQEINRLRKLKVVDTELCQKLEIKEKNVQNMDVDPPCLVDEDGFEVVVSKKQRKNNK